MLYCIIYCAAMYLLDCNVLHHIVLYYTMNCAVLYGAVQYCNNYSVLNFAVQYCTSAAKVTVYPLAQAH